MVCLVFLFLFFASLGFGDGEEGMRDVVGVDAKKGE
jgi:hypothetical protein